MSDKVGMIVVELEQQEFDVLEELALRNEISQQRVMIQGLRLYQMLNSGLYKFVEVNPMPMMVQWNDSLSEDRKAELIKHAEQIRNGNSLIVHTDPMEYHDPFTKLIEKIEQIHTHVTEIEAKLKEKQTNE